MIAGPLGRLGFLVEVEVDAGRGTSHLTSLAQSSSVYVTCSLVVTEEALEDVLEVEEMVMVVAAARFGAKEGVFERPESEGVGVVTRVEEVREEKMDVTESLSSGMEWVEDAEEGGRDCSRDGVGEKIELVAESGV